MRHFPAGVEATVLYTYAQHFSRKENGRDTKLYCLDVDGHGPTCWYLEDQLAAAPVNPRAEGC
jgi:hypothetical protein